MSTPINKDQTRDRTLERACDKAIMATLLYRSVFDSSLSFHQLSTFLISDTPIERNFLKKRLSTLVKSQKVGIRKGRYYVYGQKPLSWHSRSKNSQELFSSASPTLDILQKITWIKLLAVTGSVAAHNANKEDDVDIFIVTQKNRLWITRFFTVLILKAVNKYRLDKDFNGKICPNIFVDITGMSWEYDKRNIYIAHEILMMHPLINRDDTYFKFINANNWVFEHFIEFPINTEGINDSRGAYSSKYLDKLEKMLMKVQLWYMKKKKTTETTTNSLIHFNKKDHSHSILESFQKVLSRG